MIDIKLPPEYNKIIVEEKLQIVAEETSFYIILHLTELNKLMMKGWKNYI